MSWTTSSSDYADDDVTDEPESATTPWSERLREMFVRYNPLYFASALFVLVGVFQVGQGLEQAGHPEARVDLTFVIEVYELLVIAAAALLLRIAGQRRPAVILALLAAVFLVDPTFQTEVLALYEKRLTAVLWLVLAVAKLGALAWGLRLRPRGAVLAVPVLSLVGIAVWPQLLDLEVAARSTLHLAATWYAALTLGIALATRPSARVGMTLDAWGETVLERSLKAVLHLWPGFLVAHLVAWAFVFEIRIPWQGVVPFLLLVVLLGKREPVAWSAAALAIAASLGLPETVAPVAFVILLTFVWRGWREGRASYYVAAVVAAHLALRTLGWENGPLPEAAAWLDGVTVAILLVVAWRFKQPLALILLLPTFLPVARRLTKLGALGSGLLFLVLGFASLAAGVCYNWIHRGPVRRDGGINPVSSSPAAITSSRAD